MRFPFTDRQPMFVLNQQDLDLISVHTVLDITKSVTISDVRITWAVQSAF